MNSRTQSFRAEDWISTRWTLLFTFLASVFNGVTGLCIFHQHKKTQLKFFGCEHHSNMFLIKHKYSVFTEPIPSIQTGNFKEMTKAEMLIRNGISCLLARAGILVYLVSWLCLNETNEGEPAPVNKLNGAKWASVPCYSEIPIVLV